MTKQEIKIINFGDKQGKNKNFTWFKTDKGIMNCFDTNIIEDLKKIEGRTASVEVEENNGYKNITKFNGCVAGSNGKMDKKPISPKDFGKEIKESLKSAKYEPTSMYVSYAKDVFIALVNKSELAQNKLTANNNMKLACDLIKKMREEFK